MSETITTQAVREIAERLEEEGHRLSGRSLDHGSADSGIAANVAGAASSMLLALVEERDRLAEANAKKADDIVTLGQLVGKAEAALLDAQKRLRGAGMLGGDDDPVNAALKEGGQKQ